MNLKTHTDEYINPEYTQKYLYDPNFVCRFIFDLKQHCIYECISECYHRACPHEYVYNKFKLERLDIEDNTLARLQYTFDHNISEFAQTYMIKPNLCGIEGLSISELYGNPALNPESCNFNFTKQDLDQIEQYICYLEEKHKEDIKNAK